MMTRPVLLLLFLFIPVGAQSLATTDDSMTFTTSTTVEAPTTVDPELKCDNIQPIDLVNVTQLMVDCTNQHNLISATQLTITFDTITQGFFDSLVRSKSRIGVRLEIINSPNLTELNFANLATIDSNRGILIENNTNLKNIRFKLVDGIDRIEIRKNDRLVNITWDYKTKGFFNEIKGNKALSDETLANLMKIKTIAGYLQDKNECYFTQPVNLAVDLKDCVHVASDLTLFGLQDDPNYRRITSIAGNLVVEKTFLTSLDPLIWDTRIGGKSIWLIDNENMLISPNAPFLDGPGPESFQIRGIRTLTTGVLRKLKQRYGVGLRILDWLDCQMPIDERSLLKHCPNISGDVEFAKTARGVARLENFFNGSLIVKETQLEELDFVGKSPFRNPKICKVIILRNPKLRKIILPKDLSAFPPIRNWLIKGNPLLEVKTLEQLRQALNGSLDHFLQHFGECYFDDLIKNFKELAACRYAYGQVKITDQTQGDPQQVPNLARIIGLLSIKNTEIASIPGLYGVDADFIDISANSKLCDSKISTSRLWKEAMSRGIYQGNCEKFCASPEELTWKNCVELSHLYLPFLYPDEEGLILDRMKNIKLIGQLTIDNSDLKEIDFFDNLEEIRSEIEGEPALKIINNFVLEKIAFPKLKKISGRGGKILVVIKNNNKKLAINESWLGNISLSSMNFILDRSSSPPSPSPPVEEEKSEKTEKTMEEIITSCLLLAFLLFLMAFLATYFVFEDGGNKFEL